MSQSSLVVVLAVSLSLGWPAMARADDASPAARDLSLEELLTADVQTASRKTQRLQDVAAAAFVITRDDIERSGATSIPELLRLAPGIQVARIANNRWAVSARGFNGRFANKLLVLMDGRSVYSPLFSGVLWETEDTLLEDIDRIEVIRGPGAALWGANAVNGVVNIITRKARDTRKSLAVVGAGSAERGFAALRHGLSAGGGDLRLWAKAFRRDVSVEASGRPANDGWHAARLGFRGDWPLDSDRRLTVSGSVHDGPTGDRWNTPDTASPTGTTLTDMLQTAKGANLLGRLDWLRGDGSEAALQTYMDHSDVEIVGTIRERRNTIDVDFQHRPARTGVHDMVWGLGYRHSSDTILTTGIMRVDPRKRDFRLLSAFLQDEITLLPDTLRATLGARLDHNNFTGTEPQGNTRLIWTPTPQQSWWGAVSHATRTPSRGELDTQLELSVTPASAPVLPVLLQLVPRPDRRLLPEKVNALEFGVRQQFGTDLSLDLALFRNRYRDLRSGELASAGFALLPVPHGVQQMIGNNRLRARTEGLELAMDWHVAPGWRIQPAYTFTRLKVEARTLDPIENLTAATLSASAPRHQLSLRASANLGPHKRLDFWLRHVGTLPSADPRQATVGAYTTLDVRYAWRPEDGLELSLVGQNLLGPRHTEFVADYLPSQLLQVQRSLYVKAKWQF